MFGRRVLPLVGACGLVALWPLGASAQLVVRDQPGPRLPNPADSVPYPGGARSCNNTVADLGARAAMRAIDSCPDQFIGSRQAYFSYAKQAVLGLTIPGAQAAAGAMALEKAAENLFFCITSALIDESGGSDTDKAYAKALVAEAKENIDRADLVSKLHALGKGLVEKGLAPYLAEGEANTFVQTLDATLKERWEGTVGTVDEEGNKQPGVDMAVVDLGVKRFDTAEARANAATEQARALGRDCRFAEADAALAAAQQLNLTYLGELRAEVSNAKHRLYCLETHDQRQVRGPLHTASPFLRHSLASAQADLDESRRLDEEQARFIGQIDELHRSVRLQRNDVEAMKQRAVRLLATARDAAARCDFTGARSALDTMNLNTVACALELDAERRMRDELERQVGEAEQQLAQMGAEHAKIVATPFSDVGSCGEISIVADAFDQVQGRCREIANVESMVAALRNRAEKCTEFKAAQLVQSAKLPPPIGALHGKLTLSPEKKEDHGKGAFTRTTYEGHRVTWERVDPGQAFEVSIVWDYVGVPASLSAGQAVTITVTGGVARESPPHVSDGLVLAGVVGVWGDITMKFAQQADRGNPVGRYEFIVNQNPRSVEIHLGGAPAGTGVIWRYAVE